MGAAQTGFLKRVLGSALRPDIFIPFVTGSQQGGGLIAHSPMLDIGATTHHSFCALNLAERGQIVAVRPQLTRGCVQRLWL